MRQAIPEVNAAEYQVPNSGRFWRAPQPEHFHNALGDRHAELGNAQAARWCYERLLRMNPYDDQEVAASLEQLDAVSSPRMR